MGAVAVRQRAIETSSVGKKPKSDGQLNEVANRQRATETNSVGMARVLYASVLGTSVNSNRVLPIWISSPLQSR
jgi:hypothetical protein